MVKGGDEEGLALDEQHRLRNHVIRIGVSNVDKEILGIHLDLLVFIGKQISRRLVQQQRSRLKIETVNHMTCSILIGRTTRCV